MNNTAVQACLNNANHSRTRMDFKKISKRGRHGIRGSSCASFLPLNLISIKQTKWMQSIDNLAITVYTFYLFYFVNCVSIN